MEWRLVTSLLIGICQQGSILNKDAYIICWNILLLFFTRKEYIYNLFMCIFNELLITLSALLPLMFISHYYPLLAAVEAKIYHLLLSVLFIRY